VRTLARLDLEETMSARPSGSHWPLRLALTSLISLGACATTSSPPPAPAAAPTTFAEQVAMGQTLYAQNCANCHGSSGAGGKAPRVVGLKEGALPLDPPAERQLRKSRFVTVGDVASFAVANMPPKKAGSTAGTLTADQYWAILAFDLHANGIDLPSPLTPAAAATLTIPR
jgi:mono/diheme cytochrome c family protein